jgi:L-ascorbate metabolism protein UlaG (beta-lactamase superfamily)
VTTVVPFQTTSVGAVSITAVPALHGIPEVGFMLQASGFTVYFAGDTLTVPAFSDVAERFPNIDVALLPINGLKIFGKQVVMNPIEAARVCQLLRPRFAIPTHYAFNGGHILDTFVFNYFDRPQCLPGIFLDAVVEHAPETEVEVLRPGDALTLDHETHSLELKIEMNASLRLSYEQGASRTHGQQGAERGYFFGD